MGVLEREKGVERIFEELMTGNSPNLTTDLKKNNTPKKLNKFNQDRLQEIHIIVKLPKANDRILKAANENPSHTKDAQ